MCEVLNLIVNLNTGKIQKKPKADFEAIVVRELSSGIPTPD